MCLYLFFFLEFFFVKTMYCCCRFIIDCNDYTVSHSNNSFYTCEFFCFSWDFHHMCAYVYGKFLTRIRRNVLLIWSTYFRRIYYILTYKNLMNTKKWLGEKFCKDDCNIFNIELWFLHYEHYDFHFMLNFFFGKGTTQYYIWYYIQNKVISSLGK